MSDPTPPPPPRPSGDDEPGRVDPPPPPPSEPRDRPIVDGSGSAPGDTRSHTRTPLDQVPSPYGLLIAVIVVLIFTSPNLLVLALGDLAEAVETVERPSSAELIFFLGITMVFQLVVFAVAMLPLLAAGRPYSRVLGPTRSDAAMVAVGLGLGAVVFVASFAVNAVLIGGLGADDPVEQQLLQDALVGGVPMVLAVIIAVVVAPITEEIIFRGVLFRAIAAKAGLWVGAVVSSAVFGLIHFEIVFSQPLALAGLFLVGMLLAVAYHRTGNLLVPILGHAVFNAISVTMRVLIDRAGLDELAAVALVVGTTLGAGGHGGA